MGAGDYAPAPPVNYARGNASRGGAANPRVVESVACFGTLGARIVWEEQSADWDSFRIYKDSVLIKDVTPARSGGPAYDDDVPPPVENA
jgi:hypothetical protein